MSYAIISLGGKQYRVREGERLLVDRLPQAEGKTFTPQLLLLGGDGDTQLGPKDVTVTARVVRHVLGKKIRIAKMKPKTGYRRRGGHRSRLSQIEIESIGRGGGRRESAKPEAKRATRVPAGYEEMTVAQVAEAAPGWRRDLLAGALEFERAHAARKGAIAALEAALEAKEEKA